MPITYIANALGGTATTTTFSITLPTTVAGDILILDLTHRGTADPTIGGTSITTGGLTWTKKHSQLYATSTFSGKTYWTRATGNHSGQTVTGSGLTNACAAVVTQYRGALGAGDPLADATIVGEDNASGNETQAGITNATAGAFIVLVVANSPDVAVTSMAGTSTTLTARAEVLSTGGTDASIAHASGERFNVTAITSFTWAQVDGISGSWAYAITPGTYPDPGGALPLTDNFTDTNAVLLQNHLPDSSSSGDSAWEALAFGSVVNAEINTNRARSSNTSNSSRAYRNTAVPASAQYDVEGVVTYGDAQGYLWIGARAGSGTTSATVDRYQVVVSSSGKNLQKVIGGTVTSLHNVTPGPANGTYTVKLEIRTASKKVYIGGVESNTSADDTITQVGRVLISTFSQHSAGINYVDSLTATDFAGGGPTLVSVAGAQPSASGRLLVSALPVRGNQPSATGALTVRRLLSNVSLAGNQPTATGRIRVSALALRGNQPSGSGTAAGSKFTSLTVASAQPFATGVVTARVTLAHVTLAGSQPFATGRLLVSALRLKGNHPFATGTVAAKTANKFLQGNQPAAAGTVAFKRVLSHVSLAGAQPAASGVVTAQLLLLRSVAGNQPSSSGTVGAEITPGGPVTVTVTGNQPFATGTAAARQTLSRSAAGNQPFATGRVRVSALRLPGAQPFATGTIAAKRVLSHATLAGNQPFATGALLVKWVRHLVQGNQPNPTGAISISSAAYVTVGGTQAFATGTVVAKRVLSHVTLSGNQAYATGRARIAAVQLRGAQPFATGTIVARRLLSHLALAGNQPSAGGTVTDVEYEFIALSGNQPAASGVLAIRLVLRQVSLAGNQPSATGTVTVVLGAYVAGYVYLFDKPTAHAHLHDLPVAGLHIHDRALSAAGMRDRAIGGVRASDEPVGAAEVND